MSISDKKLATCKANAQHSTGPKSAEGKAIVAMNGLRHGLRSTRVLLPGESAEEYCLFAEGIVDALNPTDGLEASYVERIVHNAWRLRRVVDFEAFIWRRPLPANVRAANHARRAQQQAAAKPEQNGASAPSKESSEAPEPLRHIPFSYDDFHHPAVAMVSDIENRRDPLPTLTRYETHLHRQLSKDLAYLNTLRAIRQAGDAANLENQVRRRSLSRIDKHGRIISADSPDPKHQELLTLEREIGVHFDEGPG